MIDHSRLVARPDPRLHARVIARRPLAYRAGAAPALDRPAHVRAASSLAWYRGQLAVLQDDASFVALVDPARGDVEAIPLPAGPDGRRVFDEIRGTKHLKLDLEACASGPAGNGEVLLALGSGSTPARERIAVLRPGATERADVVQLVDAAPLYAKLRALHEFAGSELNLEGALYLPDGILRLFQRGNSGRASDPSDATCDLGWAALLDFLLAGGPVPEPGAITRYDLGAIRGIRLTFTDAARAADGALFYLASAEDSPDAVQDGEVVGSALGRLGPEPRWTVLRDERDEPLAAKAEGLALDPARPDRALVVIDPDDPAQPGELWTVSLDGPWAD